MTRDLERTSESVAVTPKQSEDIRSRWSWTEPSVWTDRMLTALETGVKGDTWFSLIDKVWRMENLKASWAKVKSNGGSAGVDGLTITVTAEHLRVHWPTIREALLNAVAHRNYEDLSRKVLIRVFSDRIEIASPGYPLKPLTIAKLRKGKYRPCSRNPLIANALCTLDKMEQRGTGFARMRDAMLNHGLNEPVLSQEDGFFVVTLPGPAGNYDCLRIPTEFPVLITPGMEPDLTKDKERWLNSLPEEKF